MPLQRMPVPLGGYRPPTSMGHGGRAANDHDVEIGGRRPAVDAAPRKSASSKSAPTRKTGTTAGKSNALGHGGRAEQLKERGVPRAVIGMIAREKGAAPGQKNYHGSSKAAPSKGGKK